MSGPSGSRYIGVSGASGGRGGQRRRGNGSVRGDPGAWLASVKSWSSPASQNTGTTGRRQLASRARASAAARSALWIV